MASMSREQKEQFLAGLHVGVLALTAPGAGPLTVPIWYDYTPGGTLWFITGKSSRKGQLLEVGTRVSLCAQAEAAPYKYVTVEGPVSSIDPTTDELLPMAVRYLGETRGKEYAAASTGGDSIVAHMSPERWLSVDYGG